MPGPTQRETDELRQLDDSVANKSHPANWDDLKPEEGAQWGYSCTMCWGVADSLYHVGTESLSHPAVLINIDPCYD